MVAFVRSNKLCDAIELYLQMRQSNVEPDPVTFVTLLGACCIPGTTIKGLILHASIIETGFESDVRIGSALVTMYSKTKNVEEARTVFSQVRSRNVIMWNAMLTAHVESGHYSQALSLYEEMRPYKMSNHVTYIKVLSACTALTLILYGMAIHASVVMQKLESYNLLGTALLNLYGKCGSIKSARRVFDKLPLRDLVTWNAMLSVYVLNEHEKETFEFYRQMLVESMIPDRYTFNTLLSACYRPSSISLGHVLHNDINKFGVERQQGIGTSLIGMYNKCGIVEAARKVFDQQDMQDSALWSTMLSSYAQSDLGKEALRLFERMGKEGVNPDQFTFSAVVGACSDLAALGQGKVVHTAVVDAGYDSDSAVANALVHMYCKCGNMEDAWSVFKDHHDQNTISWNALVCGYAQHGHGYEALTVFKRMQREDIKANKVTFVSVFAACAHVGLVEEGLEYFGSMREVYGILADLEHYASIVDLFGRVGRIEEAQNFLHHFPGQPDVVVWKVMLGACRVHNNKHGGRGAAEHAVELDFENTYSYVLLSNLYAEHEDLGWI